MQVEADIVAALDAGVLKGASLDVFETEPLPAASPLWGRDDVFVSPHNAAISAPQAVARLYRRADPRASSAASRCAISPSASAAIRRSARRLAQPPVLIDRDDRQRDDERHDQIEQAERQQRRQHVGLRRSGIALRNVSSSTPRPPGAWLSSAAENEARNTPSTATKPGLVAAGSAK